jgi:ribosomal protein S18 acetylase RimI-like enzyme
MEPLFQQANDKGYVEYLTRRNMEVYYAKRGISWDHELFSKNWNEFENYEISMDGHSIGVLSLSQDDVAYYIRDLQIEADWRCQGIGSRAIEYAIEIARESGFKLLRLRVFCINPAIKLYDRLGFEIRKAEQGTHYMEKEIS